MVEKQVSTYLGEPFRYEKNVREAIRKIEENRRSGGGWGWWKDTDEELWISLHAVEALEDAHNMGYSVDLDGPKLIDYFMEGRFAMDKMVKFYGFEDVNQALDDQASGKEIKPILRISQP